MNYPATQEHSNPAPAMWPWWERWQEGQSDYRVCLVTSQVEDIWRKAFDDGLELPEQLLTVKAAAAFANVCEESIRRAYRANQLRVQPFGQRGIRIHPADLRSWMQNGAKTKPGRVF